LFWLPQFLFLESEKCSQKSKETQRQTRAVQTAKLTKQNTNEAN
jgi:hypothetical protein